MVLPCGLFDLCLLTMWGGLPVFTCRPGGSGVFTAVSTSVISSASLSMTRAVRLGRGVRGLFNALRGECPSF